MFGIIGTLPGTARRSYLSAVNGNKVRPVACAPCHPSWALAGSALYGLCPERLHVGLWASVIVHCCACQRPAERHRGHPVVPAGPVWADVLGVPAAPHSSRVERASRTSGCLRHEAKPAPACGTACRGGLGFTCASVVVLSHAGSAVQSAYLRVGQE